MNAPTRFLSAIFALLAATFVCGVSLPAYAGGEGAAAKQPVPDREKKIFTNDDLEAKYGKPSVAGEMKNAAAVSAFTPTAPATAPSVRRARREPLAPERDPAWYALQTVSLGGEIASIDAEAQRLLQFRAPGNTPRAGTGLILNAPCEGVGTDNRIAQLLARRRELEAQIGDLEDTARHNDLPPGIFVDASTIAQAAQPQPSLTPAQERAALADRVGQLSQELGETQAEVAGMQADTAARRMTLLRPNGYGGNFTTDLLQRLGNQSSLRQNRINSVTDDALRAGVPARDLP
ncbi:MAG: hypothetical protein ACRD5M_16320 [Candidatus Acidiferrales bacterium]